MADDEHAIDMGVTMTIAIQRAIYEASLVERDGQMVSHLDVDAALTGLAGVAAMLLEAIPSAQTSKGLREACEEYGRRVRIAAKQARGQLEKAGVSMIDGSTAPDRLPS